ncbi:murein L,D-transpeptidase [Legionella taurinensis]|uniref:L,D-transpeptidase n=1 Tax=Legionella taurinensis TaxID=70611 RepID=A0A3A5L9Y8_9GAMM|nr:L,D-transpeptidase [Legionella taurinensis]MDX1836794.1 L,D-transpeptidase [Legionella taurinensis]PUT41215.1 L,D-transpeptidase [Legionella taurinensis]PUT42340.1 L,D-transpeptidase [Legionella taurinensis]PUT43865.1 L,D-transpeptidase [Legionella taurinensis]PUT47121.1 L,D-transpeptidase [Legionella taurinensis]
MEAKKRIRLAPAAVVLFCLTPLAQAQTQIPTLENSKPLLVLASNQFVFNPKSLSWVAINHNGKVVRSGKASGGSRYCKDVRRACRTPTGTYRIISKGSANCRSSRYPLGKGGAAMPYCMFFSKYYAIHGSYDVPNYNASHGCIRVKPHDAKWLHQNFIKIGTKVIVKPY